MSLKAIPLLTILFHLSSVFFFGYFFSVNGPQGGHGDREIAMALALFVGGCIFEFIWLFRKFEYRWKHKLLRGFISFTILFVTLPIVIAVGYLMFIVFGRVYCGIDPRNPSPRFQERCQSQD